MLKLAVCDDDLQDLSSMCNLLNQYEKIKGAALQYDVFSNAIDLLEASKTHLYHVLLLDVLMPGMNGIQAAQEIRRFDGAMKIIFLTSSREYAVQSYSVNAHYYLLKPGTADTLFPLLDKIFADAQRDEDSFFIKSASGIVRMTFSQLEYLEVLNKKLLFHLTDGSVKEFSGSLLDYEARLLSRQEFIKVHRSYVVNMECIQSLGAKALTTSAKREVPISRLLYGEVRAAYMQYLFVEKGVY